MYDDLIAAIRDALAAELRAMRAVVQRHMADLIEKGVRAALDEHFRNQRRAALVHAMVPQYLRPSPFTTARATIRGWR